MCLLPALALLPFLGKAFHIDDTQFLIHARLIAEHPLDPYCQVFVWDSMRVVLVDFPHPLLWQYALAAVAAVFGESEVPLKALSFACAVVALLGLRGLARRLGVSPLATCWLFAGSSAFLVMGSTIMPDLAAAALTIAALERLAAAAEGDRPGAAVASGVLAGAAFLTRFTALLGVGALVAFPLLRRRWSLRDWTPALVALAIVVGSELLSYASAGRFHFLSSLLRWSSEPSWQRDLRFAFNELVFLGAQLPLTGLALLAPAAQGRRAARAVLAAGALALGWGLLVERQHDLTTASLLFAWPALALVGDAVARLLIAARARLAASDAATALRWLLAGLVVAGTFATFRYEHVAVKYLLLPLPAAVLLLLDRVATVPERWRGAAATWVWASCVVGMALGLAVAVSDQRWANGYREVFAGELGRRPAPPGRRFHNAQWGLRFYAERAGWQPYLGETLDPGDEVLVSERVMPNWRRGSWPRAAAGRYELRYPGPFALLGFDHGAGFYSNYWGDLPFVPVAELRDTIWILRQPAGAGAPEVQAP